VSPEQKDVRLFCLDRYEESQDMTERDERFSTHRLLEPSNEIIAVLFLLKTSKRHFCTGDVLRKDQFTLEQTATSQNLCLYLLGVF